MGPLIAVRDGDAPAPGAGFTLVEMMVVVVVIGIVATLVTVNLGGDSARDLAREAKRLAGALEHAQALAQWQSETLGVSADGRGYRFWRRDGARPLDRAHRRRRARAAHARRRDDASRRNATPARRWRPTRSCRFVPSGRNEPYAFALASAAGIVVVAGDPIGRVRFAVVAADTRPARAAELMRESGAAPRTGACRAAASGRGRARVPAASR